MATFTVILKVPATIYAYHDIEAESLEALELRLQSQDEINEIVAEGEGWRSDVPEVNEDGTWGVEEIGPHEFRKVEGE